MLALIILFEMLFIIFPVLADVRRKVLLRVCVSLLT